MTQEAIIEKIKALTLKPCSPSQEYGFEECRKMVLSILEADKPVDAGKFAEYTQNNGWNFYDKENMWVCYGGVSCTTLELVSLYKSQQPNNI